MNGEGESRSFFPPQLERRLISALRGESALRTLTAEEAQLAARRLMAESRGFEEGDRALRERKLLPMVNRARGYAPFSRASGKPKLIVVIPYSSPEREADVVGGVGLAEGEPASGVVTRLEDQRVTAFTTFDLLAGEFVARDFGREEVLGSNLEGLREDLRRGDERPDFDRTLPATVAADAFQVLLFDEYSSSVHTAEEQQNMVHDLPLVSSIAELQYLRLQGLSASPDVSCCCCCCCCWGSCSSCA